MWVERPAGWLAVGVAFAFVGACFLPELDLGGRPCPCAPGYRCDPATNRCVTDPGTTSTGSGVTGGAGGASGGAAGFGGSGGTGGVGEPRTEQWGDAADSDHPGTVSDTFINRNTDKNSALDDVRLYTWPAQEVANAILLKWDLSTIPAGAQILSATVSLYLFESDGATYTSTVHQIIDVDPVLALADGYVYDGTNEWTPNACCTGGMPMAQADIAEAEATVILDDVAGYKQWTVTQMVQDWVDDPSTNRGMLINADDTAAADERRYFHSNEAADPTLRPHLVIEYAP